MKIRFIQPGNLPYRKSLKNLFIYDGYIRTLSNGLITLATIVKNYCQDTYECKEKSEERASFFKKDLFRKILNAVPSNN